MVAVVAYFIWSFFNATKDPDVIEASNLRMNIRNFKKYRDLYDKLQEVMEKYGADSHEANEFFKQDIWPEVKSNSNEWRRYQDYRAAKHQQEFADYVNKTLYNRNK